ncbi:MAG: chondroitinase family polysaccharide lyase [Eubacteriales bacterium]|nr:chondroitinase family polysaccharide lyase [Eubacteriales bacterium]
MILVFEDERDLKYIKPEKSRICLSTAHYKDGNHSLCWDFQEGGKLDFSVPVDYKPVSFSGHDSRCSVFGVYIYSEDKTPRTLHFRFFRKGKEQCGFDANISYTGWRSIFVKFDGDMAGAPCEDMDSLTISVSGLPGRLYLDQLVPASLMDPRSPVASQQVPFVQSPKKPQFTHYTLMKQIPKTSGKRIQDKDRICKIYEETILHNYGSMAKGVEEINSYYNDIGIVETSEGICGKPVEYFWQKEIYQTQSYPIPHSPLRLKEYVEILFSTACAYHSTKEDRFGDIYINMLRHLMDQGLQAGSSLGVLHQADYSLRMLYPSIFLMREAIDRAGLMDEVISMIKWFTEFGLIFVTENTHELVTADTLNNFSQGYFVCVLLCDDQAYLWALITWINKHLRPTAGLSGLIKEDGSIYHHCNHYTLYGMDGLAGIMPVIYVLSAAGIHIEQDAWESLSKVLLCMRFYANKYDLPIAMCGRHPNGKWQINRRMFRYWALAALERGDSLPVSVYKRLWDKSQAQEADLPLFLSDIPQEKSLEGQLTMNYACAAFHRWNDVLVSVKGFSKYLWGNETYMANNLYGRHMAYSHLEIIKDSLKESGFRTEGLDWAALPGTTAIHFPVENMRSLVYNLDDKSGFEEMLLSDQPFAGGVDNGKTGMFAMVISGHPKYDGSHFAVTSKYFVDGFVLCLGSDIQNDEERYPTYTTMFQKAGESTLKDGVIKDCMGNLYYPKPGQKIDVKQGVQTSKDQTGKGENSGFYSIAYIDHGIAPKGDCYEYGIGLLGREKLQYSILQQDRTAHIVQFGNTTYYAIFESESFKGGKWLSKTDNMLLLMVQEEEGLLKCWACQPDLGLYDHDPSQYDETGARKEVSVYSRQWIYNPVKRHNINLTIAGREINFNAKGGQIIYFTVNL